MGYSTEICEWCGVAIPPNTEPTVFYNDDWAMLCEPCLSHSTRYCEECSLSVPVEDITHSDDGKRLCPICYCNPIERKSDERQSS